MNDLKSTLTGLKSAFFDRESVLLSLKIGPLWLLVSPHKLEIFPAAFNPLPEWAPMTVYTILR